MLGAVNDEDRLTRAYAAIIAEARAQVRAGNRPNLDALAARLRAASKRERSGVDATPAAVDRAEKRALQQLERVITVHDARRLVARKPAPPVAAVPRAGRRPALRTRPTITANMEVRRQESGEAAILGWDPAPAVVSWEVRFSERPDSRSDYRVRETLTLPAAVTSVEVPLTDRPMRVYVLGRSRDGRLLRRALISALTRETWNERWQHRASAS
jgi:hypothetical protein